MKPVPELPNTFAGSGVKSMPNVLGLNFLPLSDGHVVDPFGGFGNSKIGERR